MRFVYKHFRFTDSVQGSQPDMHYGRHGFAYHYRRGVNKWTPTEKGGYTICYIHSHQRHQPGNVLLATGIAACSPKDNFCYRTGREIARGKALLDMGGARVVARTKGPVVSWQVVV